MGRVARAAAVAVPEARVVPMTSRRRPAAPDPRVTAPGSTAARQREQVEKIKAARPPAAPAPAVESPAPTSSGAGLSLPSLPAPASAAASTGSGFLLGVFAWALGLAYLRGGPAEVRQFLAAKFLNKTS